MRLEGKRAIVTGGARGIGAAIARMFTREGARVAIADIDREQGAATAKDIPAQFIPADVSREEDVARLFDEAGARLGGLDVLVNNAAYWTGDARLLDTTPHTWAHVIDGTLKSAYLCSKHAVPLMIEAGGGSIVNISSINGMLGIELTAYSAAKAGLIGLTRMLATHYGRQGVRANAICPGSIETEGARKLFEQKPESRRKLAGLTQLARIGTPDDVAWCAVYLASNESAFATGAVFVIDGGATAGIPSAYGPIIEETA